jgi:uncharacterized protein (TIGR02217 family)
MAAFHDVSFPLSLALGTSGGPVRTTEIVALSNGREARNARLAHARRHYDAGSAIRSVDDLHTVLVFFEARKGELHGFRFSDPVDCKSCPPAATPSAFDQPIGTGDGVSAAFQLSKTYGDAGGQTIRPIAKPVAGSVILSVDNQIVPAADFTLDAATGIVAFAAPPASGAVIRAGFAFDVPVRFATDRIDITLSAFNAGRIPAIPLIEILP